MSGAAVLVTVEDRTKAALAAFERGKFLREANTKIGKRVEIELRRYFAARPSNKRGWRSTNFWRRRIRNATQFTSADTEGATITIADQAMQQKIHGGPIVPREKKFLTIPARPEAYGRSPGTFTDLQYIPVRGKGALVGLLVQKDEKRGGFKRERSPVKSGAKSRLKVFYFCVSKVNQAADPDALPSPERVQEWASDEFAKATIRALKGARA